MAIFNGVVTGGGLNLRTSPSTSASSPIQIPNGTTISVSTVSNNQEWFSTAYSGHTGYVMAQFVAIASDGDTCTVTTASGSLNIRKTATTSATIIFTAAKGSMLRLLDCTSISGWYRVSNSFGTGWASSSYLSISSYPDGDSGGDSGDSSYTIVTTVDTDKNGVGGTLNMRSSASSNASVVAVIPDGATIYVQSLSGDWLAAQYNNNTGYVMGKFVTDADAYGSSSSGTTTSYSFDASRAVRYAMNHSENSPSGVACSKRNTYFSGIDGSGDCADFVHQCICAGGVPMFDGWFYRLSGIPSGWSNSDNRWSVTYSGCQRLKDKGWLRSVSYNAIQPGDLIYTYDPNATPTPYEHVTIAVSSNVTANGLYGCNICGCTTNQHNQFKQLTSTNCHCYRVQTTLYGDGNEKSVYLPESGNGGYAN